ncbi:MAG: hypothetical protein L3J36_02090 [Rhodobacteraceae bacterium]|nr:hypothetical protein [Paracoccaceae bacterium]
MRFFVITLALVLIGLIGLSAWLLLRSCAVHLPFTDRLITVCETQEAIQTRSDLRQTDRDNHALSLRIARLQRQLGDVICEAEPPPPPPPPPPEPETPSGLDPEAFDEADISVMEGCWELSSNYSVRHVRTNKITRFKYWRICFDANGQGSEIMRSTDGIVCKGNLSGKLPGNGKLTMREPGNLQCDNDSYIYRRDITCTLDQDGSAKCKTYQPETQGRDTVTLRRARE